MNFVKKIGVTAVVLAVMVTGIFNTAYADGEGLSYPVDLNTTNLKWNKSFGEDGSWEKSVSTPCLAGEYVLTVTGTTLCKLDKETGNVVASIELQGDCGYGYTPITYVPGGSGISEKVLVPISKSDNGNTTGYVQAIDLTKLDSLQDTDSYLGTYEIGMGQMISPAAYFTKGSEEYFCTGTWKGYTYGADYSCYRLNTVPSSSSEVYTSGDESQAKPHRWTYNSDKGFYWAGAATIDGKYIVVGTDDNYNENGGKSGASNLLVLDAATGRQISKYSDLQGDVRSSVVYDKSSHKVYFTTRSGYIYSAVIGDNGEIVSVEGIDYGSDSTSTPALVRDGGSDYLIFSVNVSGGSKIIAVRASDLEATGQVACPASTQSSPAVVQKDGKVYAYCTANNSTGGVYAVCFEGGLFGPSSVTATGIFNAAGYEQYCASSVTADPETGDLYYKNDSGNIFCLEYNGAYLENLGVTAAGSKLSLDHAFSSDRNSYEAVILPIAESCTINMTAPENSSFGVDYGNGYEPVENTATETGKVTGTFDFNSACDSTDVKIKVSHSGFDRVYKLNLRKASQNASLGCCAVNSSGNNAYSAFYPSSPGFSASITGYSFTGIPSSASGVNLWAAPADKNGSVEVIAMSGVKGVSGGKTIPRAALDNGRSRYRLYFSDVFTPIKVQVKSTAEDGKTTKIYTGTINKFSASVYSTAKSFRSKGVYSFSAKRYGYRKVRLKWRGVSGASGYKIYRSTKKYGTYKCVKTITKSSTRSYVNKKLKKRTYYYKVRAYKNISGYRVYSKYSVARYVRVR